MNEEEAKKILDNMSEQELNDFIFFALKEVEKENQKLETELKKKNKIIDLMAEEIVNYEVLDDLDFDNLKETFNKLVKEKKEYFKNKVKESK